MTELPAVGMSADDGHWADSGRPDNGAGAAQSGPSRLHPLTALARGWAPVTAALVLLGQNPARAGDLTSLVLIIALVLIAGIAVGAAAWWFTRYEIDSVEMRIHSGVVLRRSRHLRLDRIQAVDVVQPLIGRILGLAELRMEVAGSGVGEGRLAYLSEPMARRLRAELLARAAGVDPGGFDAPEQILVRVPTSAVLASAVLDPVLLGAGALVVLLVGIGVIAEEPGVIAAVLAVGAAGLGALWRTVEGSYGFTVAASPDGLRLRHGLLDKRSQTVPPGRVQAVRIEAPALWRSTGWVRVRITVAGYAGGDSQEAAATSTLLPVAPRAVALALLPHLLAGSAIDDVVISPPLPRAALARPLWWRGLGWGADESIFVARSGLLTRRLDVVTHAKVQSVRLSQGPWQRRLGVATVYLDTTPGPVAVVAAHRPVGEARRLVAEQAARSWHGPRGAEAEPGEAAGRAGTEWGVPARRPSH